MAADPDEEALSWSGETDPTHVAVPATPRSGGAARDKTAQASEEASAQLNPAALVVFGILAGVYLLYAVGWGFFGFTSVVPVQGVFFGIMYQVGEALAVASPFLWAGAVWLGTKKTTWRLVWLFIGVLVLAPWPLLLLGMR